MASYLSSVAGGWKPLKGMRRAALPCLHPPPAACRSSPPPLSEDDVRRFCSSLSEDLSALERSLGGRSVSFRWSADAMRVLKKMHVELLALFRSSRLPISLAAEEGWFDQYMEETAVLLDLCNHLKSVSAAVSRYRMVVDLAIQKIGNGSGLELEKLEAELQKLLEASRRRAPTPPHDRTAPSPEQIRCDKSATGVAMLMLAAKSATVAISLLLVSAFVSPESIDVAGPEQIALEFPPLGPVSASLASLAGRFRESCCSGGSGVVLAEHRLLRESVGQLGARLREEGRREDGEETGRGVVQLARQRSLGLKEGIELFDTAVDEVFEEMIRGRNELLRSFRDEALSPT